MICRLLLQDEINLTVFPAYSIDVPIIEVYTRGRSIMHISSCFSSQSIVYGRLYHRYSQLPKKASSRHSPRVSNTSTSRRAIMLSRNYLDHGVRWNKHRYIDYTSIYIYISLYYIGRVLVLGRSADGTKRDRDSHVATNLSQLISILNNDTTYRIRILSSRKIQTKVGHTRRRNNNKSVQSSPVQSSPVQLASVANLVAGNSG